MLLQHPLSESALQRRKSELPARVVPYHKLYAAAAQVANAVKQDDRVFCMFCCQHCSKVRGKKKADTDGINLFRVKRLSSCKVLSHVVEYLAHIVILFQPFYQLTHIFRLRIGYRYSSRGYPLQFGA